RHSVGFFPYYSRIFVIAHLYNKDGRFAEGTFEDCDDVFQVDWVEGSFLLTRRQLWNKLGGLDENYFMYVEDVDFCKRALDIGFRTVYLPSVTYQHIGGYTHSRLDLLIKGFRLFNRKHANLLRRISANVVLDIGLVGRFVKCCSLILVGAKDQKIKARACITALLNR
ncbi:MAG: hypothetical protein R3261_10895, partial [Alphaproteobacteria bacterium]|nr:hypothetical protein [Alphaproteobacteria bacterium]